MAKREPEKPTTATIDVPALGRTVTVRALSKEELAGCIPSPFNLDAMAVSIICKGVTSERLHPATVWKVYDRYGDGPLIRIGGAIVALSGFGHTPWLLAAPSPLQPTQRKP